MKFQQKRDNFLIKMKLITKYELYLESLLINESNMYFSKRFRELLSQMDDCKISKNLLHIESEEIGHDISIVDIGDNIDYLQFITLKSIERSPYTSIFPLFKGSPENSEWKNDAKKFSDYLLNRDIPKNPIRIGRLINKILPDKYTDREIEIFVNKLKSKIDSSGIELVSGDDIYKYYNSSNNVPGGSLGSSCMRSKPDNFFDIYAKNPEVCRMMVIRVDDKIKARALVWKINSISSNDPNKPDLPSGDIYFMDRPYTSQDYDIDKMYNYAKKRGWLTKNPNDFSVNLVSYNNTIFDALMTVQLGSHEYDKFPYSDTFRVYRPGDNILLNISEKKKGATGDFYLDRTNGSVDIQEDQTYWSEYRSEYILSVDSVWSNRLQSWLDIGRSTMIKSTSRGDDWYPIDSELIVMSHYYQYILLEDSLPYRISGYYILKEDAIEVIDSIDISTGRVESTKNYHRIHDIPFVVSLDTLEWQDRIIELGWSKYKWISKALLEFVVSRNFFNTEEENEIN
jgi:hypothetical protein